MNKFVLENLVLLFIISPKEVLIFTIFHFYLFNINYRIVIILF